MIQIYLEKTKRQIKGVISDMNLAVRPDFTSKLADGLAFGTPTIYIAPYDKINYAFSI